MCIIGETSSGKSSLLDAISGNILFIPENLCDEIGNLKHTPKYYSQIQLDFEISESPIKISGKISYCE